MLSVQPLLHSYAVMSDSSYEKQSHYESAQNRARNSFGYREVAMSHSPAYSRDSDCARPPANPIHYGGYSRELSDVERVVSRNNCHKIPDSVLAQWSQPTGSHAPAYRPLTSVMEESYTPPHFSHSDDRRKPPQIVDQGGGHSFDFEDSSAAAAAGGSMGEGESSNTSPHQFTSSEVEELRASVIDWYDKNARTLPWRTRAKTERDDNARGYAVWVSEVMLQQTQVATVIDYYNRWMKLWPTVVDLGSSDLESVHKAWSGLGYYSRGDRLREAARKVVSDYGGEIPKTSVQLQQLPGIGRYTASAIASIAYNEPCGVVDGNMMRVLSRMRLIGSDISVAKSAIQFWTLANEVVCPKRPGDFNQAMMDIGATVCTYKTPDCDNCPLQSLCHGYQKVHEIKDIEECGDDCLLCLKSDGERKPFSLTDYPLKSSKKPRKVEHTLVGAVFQKDADGKDAVLLVKRPEKGLLAGYWECPSVSTNPSLSDPDETVVEGFSSKLETRFGLPQACLTKADLPLQKVSHNFTHIKWTYNVLRYDLVSPALQSTASAQHPALCEQPRRTRPARLSPRKADPELKLSPLDSSGTTSSGEDYQWCPVAEVKQAALSTAMRKVIAAAAQTFKVRKMGKAPSFSPPATAAATGSKRARKAATQLTSDVVRKSQRTLRCIR